MAMSWQPREDAINRTLREIWACLLLRETLFITTYSVRGSLKAHPFADRFLQTNWCQAITREMGGSF